MMYSTVEAICALRGELCLDISEELHSRYCVNVREKEATVSYYFSAPIRALTGGPLLNMEWLCEEDDVFVHHASGCSVYVRADSILFKSPSDTVRVQFSASEKWSCKGKELVGEKVRLECTLNGIGVRIFGEKKEQVAVCVTPSCLDYDTRVNSKFFAIMKSKFHPVFTVSILGSSLEGGVLAPLVLKSQFHKSIKKYRISTSVPDTCAGDVWMEMNMYEPKLLQDTTVESASPKENNAFGSVAFVGYSDVFDEQQLYIKFDYSRFTEMKHKHLVGVRLWLPLLSSQSTLEAYAMNTRFCSFGSTWNRRVPHSKVKLPVVQKKDFCCVDLSQTMIDASGRLKFSNGLLLKAAGGEGMVCILTTGDNYMAPPILEFKYLS